MSDEKFCLKWNDFDLNLKSSFRDLRDSKDLFDMTLVCGEFHQVQAHKVILSASSPFFRDVLASNPHVNPLIYLRGISQTDLQYILDFIYHGEVSVAQSNLNNFLSVAEDLKIKGLTQSQTDPKASSKSEPKHRRPAGQQQPQRSRQSLVPTEDEVEIEEVPVRVKNEAADNTIQDHTVALDQDYGHGAYSGGDLMEGDYGDDEVYEDPGLQLQDYAGATDKELLVSLDAQIESMMYKADREWHCSVCGKSGMGKTDISRHIEGTHITNHPGLQCDICGEKLKSRNALRLHKSSKHKSFFVM